MTKILIVDDDAATRNQLGLALRETGHEVQIAASGEEAIALLATSDAELVISDLIMGSVGGIEVLDAARRLVPETPVLILTGQGTIETAVEAMRRGALDYLTKPINLDRLELVIEKALASRRILRENADLRRQLADRRSGRKLLGTAPSVVALLADVDRIAETSATVLITGESGTGKELVADAIHHLSTRAVKPLIKVNCAALAEGVLESELFGHERGAFTGANRARQGRFEAADGGTLFLDEIGDLSVSSQLRLFRVLQERSFERVGSSQPIVVDVRVIAATNKDLEQAVKQGTFREELYYRLSVVTLRTPPLRERRTDIPLLVGAFIHEFDAAHARAVESLTPAALRALARYDWPGNVRELRNCIESLVVMSRRPQIEEADLPPQIRGATMDFGLLMPVGRTLDDANREYILHTLQSCDGNKARAARVLGIGTKTLYRKLHEYGVFIDGDAGTGEDSG